MKKLVLIVLLLAVTACAGSSGSKSSATPRDRATLTADDIQKTGAIDAFTAVQALRPQWLTKRGSTSFRQVEVVRVYLDGNLMGGPEQLRQITTSSVETIRYMDGLEATQRYGLDHGQGAVLVFTKKGR
ncbi:MAG TPA: hypothetical protein VGC44_10160 [Longimicrobiales bacterium]